jgi:Tfp pilus assembly protein FimV
MTIILQKSPEYGPAHLSRAKELAAENNLDESVAEAEFALAHLDGGRVAERDAHYLLARLYLRLKQPQQAESSARWLNGNP